MRMLARKSSASISGSRRLRSHQRAMRDWVTTSGPRTIFSAPFSGAHPYPTMVRDFQSMIGAKPANKSSPPKNRPAHASFRLRRRRFSNFHRPFYNFLRDADVKMIGIEAGGTRR